MSELRLGLEVMYCQKRIKKIHVPRTGWCDDLRTSGACSPIERNGADSNVNGTTQWVITRCDNGYETALGFGRKE